ncbi:hypothetical protein B0J11DRAFT_517252 [Dendryphion nanum]|uniref:Fumarylacetoacetase n=1 Tax=Dendryphion nanum TaxID=256645 RepID=A0A9P9EBS1_9PLEO|nr:hypothetical protein B0J11DRAFT_517252 [Dendryphion nanum]
MSSSEAAQFGIENIPYGIASSNTRSSPQAVTRIGDEVIFLADLADKGAFGSDSASLSATFRENTLNTFAGLSKRIHTTVRSAIQLTYKNKKHVAASEHIKDVKLHIPVHIGDFTDFSASKDHLLNAGEAMMGIRALPPSFLNYPIVYAGRSSSIRVSGSPVARPLGQYWDNPAAADKRIIFGPCRTLDYELEVGAVIGRPVKAGAVLKARDADEHIFGLVLVNDWSARDIQGLEMYPLGPFNGKNFGTTISPWIVTLEALSKHKVPAPPRDVPVADFMDDPEGANYDLNLSVDVVRNGTSHRTCSVGFNTMYWTFRHMLAHHTIGGCDLRTGDILASGTVSGEGETEHGCLLELVMGGKKPWKLNDGGELRYLEDGDEVRFTGIVGGADSGIGFGGCSGVIHPAPKI